MKSLADHLLHGSTAIPSRGLGLIKSSSHDSSISPAHPTESATELSMVSELVACFLQAAATHDNGFASLI
jgi:hypothetical protein